MSIIIFLLMDLFLIDKNIEIGENVNNLNIILLDDIYTTGATLYHARDKLQEGFPNAVIKSFTICR